MPDTGDSSAVTESRARRGILRFRPASAKPGRLQFIDLLRGWAVLIMIETHVLNGMLNPELTHTLLFKVLNFVNGLVAPAFLFASGLAFAVATRRKLPDYLAFRAPLLKQLAKLGLLFIIGYGLHIPKFSYHHLRYDTGEAAWQAFFQVDVLQCIAMSLLMLLVLMLVLRTEQRAYRAAALILGGMVLTTPFIWIVDFQNLLPLPLAQYINGLHQSLFPLSPWAVFVLAGALSGYYYLQHARQDPAGSTGAAARGMQRLTVFALAAVVVSFIIEPLAAALYPVYDYWRTSPSFTLLRTGLVMLILSGFYFYERRRPVSPSSILAMAGRESLLIYTVHLMILYGNFHGPHLVERVGFRFGFAEVFGLSAILIAAMVLLAYLWNAVKAGAPWFKHTVEGVVVAGFLYVFFIGL